MKRVFLYTLTSICFLVVFFHLKQEREISGKYVCYNCYPNISIFLGKSQVYLSNDKSAIIGYWELDGEEGFVIILNKIGSNYLKKYLYLETISGNGKVIMYTTLVNDMQGISFSLSADGAIFVKVN